MRQPETPFQPGTVITAPFWPTPMKVLSAAPRSDGGAYLQMISADEDRRFSDPYLSAEQLSQVQIVGGLGEYALDGDPDAFKLATEATRIQLAHTYDPQFAVSTARIEPLPHQLEAVYHYMLKKPRLRFLLADDPGAGKTIMAGLLIKEMKLRGVATRTLLVVPANLVDQWQREMASKFNEDFDAIDRGALDTYGSRAWELSNQCVVSVDFAWREDVMETLARAERWDLVVVDEAHKMAAYRRGNKVERTRRYQLGQFLSEHAEHLLLMTATPHKGDPDNFHLLLQLLDRDLFANVELMAQAARRKENPIFLRRMKEDMVDFDGHDLFLPRHIHPLGIELTPLEHDLYERVTEYVRESFNRAIAEENRNVSFALIVLQRRLASSVRAIRRSLENRRDRLIDLREEVRANPDLMAAAHNGGMDFDALPDDLTESARWDVEEQALRLTVARNMEELEEEIATLDELSRFALYVEGSGPEAKLQELKTVLEQEDIFGSDEKLLIFTEAKDTLNYLVEHLTEWGFPVTVIHGDMKMEERVAAEREFAGDAQIMVATEAAGEGINLQFCSQMVNWDLPWNPTRLEQRMGRIHRYGQKHDVHIYNLIATNTREGMVFHALLKKLEEMRAGMGRDKVFDVVSQLLEDVPLEQQMREALAGRITFEDIRENVLSKLTPEQLDRLQDASQTGLATSYVDLSRVKADQERAQRAHVSPHYTEAFFTQAMRKLAPGRLELRDDGYWRIPYVPSAIRTVPNSVRRRFGEPRESYAAITFDKANLDEYGPLVYVGPGQALFESAVYHIMEAFGQELTRGAVLSDPEGELNGLLWLILGAVVDGTGSVAGKRLYALYQDTEGNLREISPTRFLSLDAPADEIALDAALKHLMESSDSVLDWSLENVMRPYKEELQIERQREADIRRDYLKRSFDVLIVRAQSELGKLKQRQLRGESVPDVTVINQQRRLDDLRRRQEERLKETSGMSVLLLNKPEILGVAAVLPAEPPVIEIAPGYGMHRDDEVEALAMERVMEYERARGWTPQDVSDQPVHFDVDSRGPHGERRCIEVKGRAGVGAVELSEREWERARELGDGFWLYIVTNARTTKDLYLIQDPASSLPPDAVVVRRRFRVTRDGWKQVADKVEDSTGVN